MPHHCTVCRDTVKPACFHRGHVARCRAATCKLVYQSSREKDCPYCRNASQKRAAREGSLPKDEGGGDQPTESPHDAGGDGSDKENDPPSLRAQAQKQRQNPQPKKQKKKKKKGKHVRETRRLKDIRRGRRLN